jgi:hypothetical protein
MRLLAAVLLAFAWGGALAVPVGNISTFAGRRSALQSPRSNSLMPVFARVFASTCLMITAQ